MLTAQPHTTWPGKSFLRTPKRPPSAQNSRQPLSFLSFFLSSSSTPYIQNGVRKALRSARTFAPLFLFSSSLTLSRTTVAPWPSWSLLSTTTSTWSWSRLRPTLLPLSTVALSTARSAPLARSLPSRVPTASLSPRPSPLPSMVSEDFPLYTTTSQPPPSHHLLWWVHIIVIPVRTILLRNTHSEKIWLPRFGRKIWTPPFFLLWPHCAIGTPDCSIHGSTQFKSNLTNMSCS